MISNKLMQKIQYQYEKQKPILIRNAIPPSHLKKIQLSFFHKLLINKKITSNNLRLSRNGMPFKYSELVNHNGCINREVAISLATQKTTLIFEKLNNIDSKISKISNQVGKNLREKIHINGYLTPPSSKGFGCHFDVHDVIVIQTQGEKVWKLWKKSISRPLPFENFQVFSNKKQRNLENSEAQTFCLKEGDLLYFPKGYLHAVETMENPSIHLTLGVETKTFFEGFIEKNQKNKVDYLFSIGFAYEAKENLRAPLKESNEKEIEYLQTKFKDYKKRLRKYKPLLQSIITARRKKINTLKIITNVFNSQKTKDNHYLIWNPLGIKVAYIIEDKFHIKGQTFELILAKDEMEVCLKLINKKQKIKKLFLNNPRRSLEFAKYLLEHSLVELIK